MPPSVCHSTHLQVPLLPRNCTFPSPPHPTPDHQPRVGVRAKARLPMCIRARRALSVLQLQEPLVPQVTWHGMKIDGRFREPHILPWPKTVLSPNTFGGRIGGFCVCFVDPPVIIAGFVFGLLARYTAALGLGCRFFSYGFPSLGELRFQVRYMSCAQGMPYLRSACCMKP